MLKPLLLAGLLALGLAFAAAPPARPAAPAPGGREASQVAQRLLARCASLRTLRASLAGEVAWQGTAIGSKMELAFARGLGQLQIRLDIKAPGGEAHAVLDGRRSTLWVPGPNLVMRQDLPADPGHRWDAFASPVESLVALLAPTAEDRARLERTFLPRVRLLPPDRLAGQTVSRLQGRGAYGAEVDFWLRPDDGTPVRILLRQPDLNAPDRMEFRIDVQRVDQPLPAGLFELAVPKNAVNTLQPARRPVWGPRVRPEPLDPKARLRALAAKAARTPRSATAQMQLAEAYEQTSQSGPMVSALRKAVALDPSVDYYRRAWQMAAQTSQWKPAVQFFRAGVERHGEQMLAAGPDREISLPDMAQAAEMAPLLAATLEKLVPRAHDPWRVRALLIELYGAADDPAPAAEQWLVLIAPDRKAFAPERLEAIEGALDTMGELALPAALKPKLAAAVRAVEAQFGPDLAGSVAALYLNLDAPGDAARLIESASDQEADVETLGRIGAAVAQNGDQNAANRLFRQALAQCVQEPAVNFTEALQLVSIPEALAGLVPVLHQLAESDRIPDPLAAAHWLYLAADYSAAAAAYARYLDSPAAAPESTAASKRYVAAALGALSARRAGDHLALDRFAALALVEMPFAEVEMASEQTLAGPLLDATAGTAAFGRMLEGLAESSPQSAWVWLGQHGAPEDLDGATIRRVLGRLISQSGAFGGASSVPGALVRLGRPEEALEPLIAALQKDPIAVNPAEAIAVCAHLGDPGPLLNALGDAVRRHPAWRAGALLLARCRWARGEGDGALQALDDPRGAPSPDDAALLAGVQWRMGRRREAIATLRAALAAKPDEPSLLSVLAGLLERSGDPSGALEATRKLASRPGARQAAAVASALARLGQPAEGARLLERLLRAQPDGDAAAARRTLAEIYLQMGRPQQVPALYKPALADLERAEFPETENPEQHEGLSPLAQALEKAKPVLARRAYAAAILARDAVAKDFEAYVRLTIAARSFEEARGVLESRTPSDEREEENPCRQICLALVDEAAGSAPRGRAAALCERIVHPYGDRFPHASPEAEIACDTLAGAAAAAGREGDAAQFRRWAGGIHALLAGDADGAAGLFPELPCIALRRARGASRPPVRRDADADEPAAADPLDLDLDAARRGLDQLLSAPAAAHDCPICRAALGAVDQSTPLIRDWLAARDGDARAYFLAATSAASGEERPGAIRRVQRYLERAVALDPNLAPAWRELRDIYEQQNAPAAAILQAAARAAAGDPQNATAQAALARALAGAGRQREADAALQRARRLSPGRFAGMAGNLPWEDVRDVADPLVQMLSYLDQRTMMSVRWMMLDLPGLPMGGMLINPGRMRVAQPGQ